MVGGAIVIVIAAILAAAAISKTRSFRVFREQLADYRLVPYRLTPALASAVILAEGATAVLLLLPHTGKVGAVSATVLFGGFTIVLFLAWRGEKRVDCGCFGGSGELSVVGVHSLVRTGLMLISSVLLLAPLSTEITGPALILSFLIAVAIFLSAEVARLLTDLRMSVHEAIHWPQVAATSDPSE